MPIKKLFVRKIALYILSVTSVMLPTTKVFSSDDYSSKAMYCFNPPPGVEDFAFVLDVVLDDLGNPIQIDVRDGWRPDRATVKSGARAVESCGPYDGNIRKVFFEFNDEKLFDDVEPKLDPFKN